MIPIETVKKVAKIARLNLTEKEIVKFQKDMSDILEAFKEIDKVNTNDVKPSFHSVELKDNMREDNIEECLLNEVALSNTKNKENGNFKGPRAV